MVSARYLFRNVLGFICLLLFVANPIRSQTTKPNIVFILVDNVGWGNFGVYGGTVPTPRIDKLASEGIRFNNYNVEVQCTPSRSAINYILPAKNFSLFFKGYHEYSAFSRTLGNTFVFGGAWTFLKPKPAAAAKS